MKGSFRILANEKNVITERGVRVFIMERLLNSPFERGTVLNIDEKTVEVRMEGTKKQILEFKAELEKELIAKYGNPVILFTPLQSNRALQLPALMRSGQALVLGQLSKGVDVQLKILETLTGQKTELGSLPERLGKVIVEYLKSERPSAKS
ncbi:MAG: hypothetical protein V1676_06950 [Candidatus Diapherotrites archaeon]